MKDYNVIKTIKYIMEKNIKYINTLQNILNYRQKYIYFSIYYWQFWN